MLRSSYCSLRHTDSDTCALIVHGLNQNPATFSPLASTLQSNGISSCLLSLTAHRRERKTQEWHSASTKRWVSDVEKAINTMRIVFPDKRITAIAYSIGAAVLMNYLMSKNKNCFERIVLIAPALALRRKTNVVKFLAQFKNLQLSLPSAAPKQYRAFSWTSLHSYDAAFSTIDKLQNLDNIEVIDSNNTLVLMSEKDEIVDYHGVTKWIRGYQLDNWQVNTLTPKPDSQPLCHHLIVDEPSLGAEQWEQFTRQITNFLIG